MGDICSVIHIYPLLKRKYRKRYTIKFFLKKPIITEYDSFLVFYVKVAKKYHIWQTGDKIKFFNPYISFFQKNLYLHDRTQSIVIAEKFFERTNSYIFKDNEYFFTRNNYSSFSFIFKERNHFHIFLELIEEHIRNEMDYFDKIEIHLPIHETYIIDGKEVFFVKDHKSEKAFEVAFEKHVRKIFRNEKALMRYMMKNRNILAGRKFKYVRYAKLPGKKEYEYFRTECGRLENHFSLPCKIHDEILQKFASD